MTSGISSSLDTGSFSGSAGRAFLCESERAVGDGCDVICSVANCGVPFGNLESHQIDLILKELTLP